MGALSSGRAAIICYITVPKLICSFRFSDRMVSGPVGGSGSAAGQGGVLGVETGAGARRSGGNLLNKISSLNYTAPSCERWYS